MTPSHSPIEYEDSRIIITSGFDENYSHSWWGYHDDDVYPHRKTRLAPREEPNE